MVHGLMRLMESDYSKPVNLGIDQEINILDLDSLIRSKINHQIGFEFFDLPLDNPRFIKSCMDLAKRELVWNPKVDFSEGLKKTAAYLKI